MYGLVKGNYSGALILRTVPLLLAIFLNGCGSTVQNETSADFNHAATPAAFVAPAPAAAVSGASSSSTFAYVGQATAGTVSPNVMGLDYPKATIMKSYCPFCAAGTGQPAARMIALMRTAGVRHLRIVTDEVGTVISYVAVSPAMNQSQNRIGNLDLQNFASFICSVPGLTFSWGLNYLQNTPANAAAEAWEINKILGPNGTVCQDRLTGFEIGNEPDSPGYGPVGAASAATFATGWHQFASAILSAVPTAVFVGPSLGGQRDVASYMPEFLAANSHLLGVLTQHYYQEGTVASASIAGITLNAPEPNLATVIGPALEATSADNGNIPIEINEGSTVANGGAAGVSNSFASALYAVTNAYDFSMATYGAGPLTLDFTSEGTPLYGQTFTQGYSPIFDGPVYTGPNPMLSGMTLVNMIGPGTLKECTLSTTEVNLRCFVVASGSATKVVLVNQDPSQSEQVTTVFPQAIHTAGSILMTAPSLDDTNPATVTIQGSAIQSTGAFAPGPPTAQTIAQGTQVTTSVPAHSVVVVSGD